MKRILITGGGGQLATELVRTSPNGLDIRVLTAEELDITSADAVMSETSNCCPDIVINAAAYTAVDLAESEPEMAFAVNERGPLNLVNAARKNSFRILHVSTDFVFDGNRSGPPYLPTDTPGPLGVYGASKLAGERQILQSGLPGTVIVRTAWLYSSIGKNFVLTILRLLKERNSLGVVADQVGSPTWARSLAQTLWKFSVEERANGLYHWTDAGEVSWHEFAVAIQEEGIKAGLIKTPIPINPIKTSDYPLPAVRPVYSVLDCSSSVVALGHPQHEWRQNLHLMMAELAA